MQQRNGETGVVQILLRASLLALASLACGQILGDIDVQTDPLPLQPGAPQQGVDDPTASTSCEPGDVRCSAVGKLQACVRFELGAPGGWLDQYDCGSPELCFAGPPAVCKQGECRQGEVSCSGATPRVCNATLTGWDDLPACESAAHCSTQATQCPEGAPCCLVEPCAPGELRCNGGSMEECQADLSGWAPLTTCGTQELCESSLAACGPGAASCTCQAPVCSEGETRCDGSTLQVCNTGRTDWDFVSTCNTPELCTAGLALSPAHCEPPVCSPNQFVCEGAELRSCRPDLTGFDDFEPCVGPGFCNADAGRCDPAPCEAGERSCNGAQIQICTVDRTGFQPDGAPCATAELCNDADPLRIQCDDPRCAVGEFNCFGSNQLQVCNAGRTAFEPSGPACLRPDLCSAERRRCDFCFPGRQECTPDNQSSRVCSLSGNFFGPETFCPLGCIPATGQCVTCNVGDYQCSNGNLSRCNDGRSFTALNRPTDCSNGQQVQCTNGIVLRNSCQAGLFCGGTGQCICTPGPAFCSGDTLVACDGTGLVTADQCQGDDGDILTTCDNGDLNEDQCDSARECARSEGPRCGD
jgi:hypothetical protein